jgi:hypothetical protein
LPLVPIAAFLAGALLTILLPLALLIALSVWYWGFSLRVPETAEKRRSSTDPAAATPGPNTPQDLPRDPGN